MKTWIRWITAAAFVVTAAVPAIVSAQAQQTGDPVVFEQRNLGGPRMGVTIVPGNSEAYHKLIDADMGRTLSQFGWHFEKQVVPTGGGPQLVIETVILFGGVEYGKIVPSGTLLMGIRFPTGFEVGLGPNLVGTESGGASALVIGIGKTINYGGVSIPLNLAVATSPAGQRISFLVGYAIGR